MLLPKLPDKKEIGVHRNSPNVNNAPMHKMFLVT